MGHKSSREYRANRSRAHQTYAWVYARLSAIKVFFKGKEYFGEYEVAGRMLRAFFDGRLKIGLVRGSNPEFLARLFLIDLVSGV